MVWQVQRTESFDKWWKRERVDDSNYAGYERALKDFKNVPLPHNRQSCLFQNSSFECWSTRLPDKARRKGKSGGFRVIFVIDLEEGTILLQGIFRRDNLSYKGEGGKHDNAQRELLADLFQEFVGT